MSIICALFGSYLMVFEWVVSCFDIYELIIASKSNYLLANNLYVCAVNK